MSRANRWRVHLMTSFTSVDIYGEESAEVAIQEAAMVLGTDLDVIADSGEPYSWFVRELDENNE